ncbi:MAG: NDP-sugar synthase [Armatimonadota bacterium]
MQAIILAGGSGTRLHPPTTKVPKSLLPIFDKPLLEHTVRMLAESGINDIIITLSPESQKLIDYLGEGLTWGVKIRYFVEYKPLGTGGCLKHLKPLLDESFFIIPGDIITNINITDAIQTHKKKSSCLTILTQKTDDPANHSIFETNTNGLITKFAKKPSSNNIFSNIVSTGIVILDKQLIFLLPEKEVFDYDIELIPKLIDNNYPIYAENVDGYFKDIGSLIDYRNCHFDALTGKIDLYIQAAKISDGVWIGEGISIHDSVALSAPIFLGNRTCVKKGAHIGPNVVIAQDSMVEEDAKIEYSILGHKCQVGSKSVIKGCVLGCECSVTDSAIIRDCIEVMPELYEQPGTFVSAQDAIEKIIKGFPEESIDIKASIPKIKSSG